MLHSYVQDVMTGPGRTIVTDVRGISGGNYQPGPWIGPMAGAPSRPAVYVQNYGGLYSSDRWLNPFGVTGYRVQINRSETNNAFQDMIITRSARPVPSAPMLSLIDYTLPVQQIY